ncbi:hypothetical protein OSB04_000019 [Centaurea solstitialis]|uniref:Exocyst subunit Exo70 family protein n=1 Tax=Centaurea solstitialis TaxID=347529 RepID=A0AA38U7R3_9ASTR|nr:hypothetical protein OSB04_000019 [Centaurea solstitialis]
MACPVLCCSSLPNAGHLSCPILSCPVLFCLVLSRLRTKRTLIEQKLVAAANLIIRELDSENKLSHKAKKILTNLRAKLLSTSKIDEDEDEEEEEVSDIEKRIDSVKTKTMIWTYEPDEVKEYLKQVDGLRQLVERLESLNPSKDSEQHRLLTKANGVLSTSIHRIEGLFKRTLVYNRYNFVPTRVRSSEDDGIDAIVSFMDDSNDDDIERDGIRKGKNLHLIDPEAIPDLKSIASIMSGTNYRRKCIDSFISVRKDVLDDLLFILEIEKSSIEDVWKMKQAALSSKIKRWGKAMRIFLRIYLASEKFLCEQIFGQDESVSALYFSDTSKASILQFLNFAEAFAIGRHKPKKILTVLGMHDALANLTRDIESIYPQEDQSYLRFKIRDVLSSVRYNAGATFYEFTNVVRFHESNVVVPNGEIHPLTRYVMNYVTTLAGYKNSLNIIFNKHSERYDQDSSSLLETTLAFENDNVNEISSSSPMGLRLRSLMSILESNLEKKSRSYKEKALGHLFLMNNVHHMGEKVERSKLKTILGDDWIRENYQKFQHYSMSYERYTWSPILELFREEEVYNLDSSSSKTKTLFKKRLQKFHTMFKEIYKSQTGWLIPNNQLRDEMRISISEKVIPAYRTSIFRAGNRIDEKYIKYSAEDLKNYLLDLFEGSPASL